MQTRNESTRKPATAERDVAPGGGASGQPATPADGSTGLMTRAPGHPGVRERRPWRGVDRMVRSYETK
jgi:hypothetical protein